MIDQKNISLEWINSVSRANKNADKILVEKVIRALLLLEGLVHNEIPFVFKGGTALMLHLNSTKRLSIDIDIIYRKYRKISIPGLIPLQFNRDSLEKKSKFGTLKQLLVKNIINSSIHLYTIQIKKRSIYY